MNRNLFFSLIITVLISSSVSAQKKKVHYRSINTFEAVGGQSNVNTAFQTVNGIQFSNWLSGIGIGIDNYRYRTLPLFFDARWFFGYEKREFIYGDIGYNFPMKNKPGKEIPYYNTYYHFTGGVYSDIGIGYLAPLFKKSSLSFSLGYSSKALRTKTGLVNPCLIAPCPVNYNIYNYSFNRMILKAGLIF